MDKNYIIHLLENHSDQPVHSFDCNILNYVFKIEDYDGNNLKEIETLFSEYIHPSSLKNFGNFHFSIRNIKNISLVEKFYELRNSFGRGIKIQTFKDDTHHEVYSIFDKSISIFFPEDSEDYIILSYEENYYFICKENMNTYLLRILREIYFRSRENLGDVAYHGGGIKINEEGVMVCGEKSKGKTTFILEQLKKGSSYLSNDRILISRNDKKEYFIKYLPLSMRIGIGTINITPALMEVVSSYAWNRKQSIKVLNYSYNNHEKCINEFGKDEKLEMTSKEIQKIFKANLVEYSSLKAIIFPHIDPDFSGMEVLPCDPLQAAKLILEQCMTPVDDNWINPWLLQREKSNEELRNYVEEFTYDLVQNVKAYTVHFGLDAYRNWDMKLF